MGRHSRLETGLSEALFSSVQRRVLALFFGQPERSFQSAEMIRLVKGGTGAVHRELTRLAEAGWVTVAAIGNQKHYQANRACPAFHELHGLVVKTLGVPKAEVHAGRAGRQAGPSRSRPAREPKEKPPEPARAPASSPDEGWKTW